MRVSLVIALMFAVAGCSTSPKRAIVNDMTVPKEFDTGYRVVAVDSAPVNRAKGKDKSTAPVALVDAGKHTFTIQSPASKDPVKMEATVEPFKEYRIAKKEDGSPTLVEFTRYPDSVRQ